VAAPNSSERQRILDELYKKFTASPNLKELFTKVQVVGQTDGFTFGYLRELVRSCVSHETIHATINEDQVTKEVERMRKRLQGEQQADSGRKK
jgi:hypothetical protein